MFFYSTDQYDMNLYSPLGLINANHVEAVSIVRTFGAELLGVFGNRSGLLTTKFNDALVAVNKELMKIAKEQYPNAVGVVGVHYNTDIVSTQDNSTFISVIAYGTVLSSNKKGGRMTRRNRIKKQ